ncbi:DUF6053 domain-containing protein [Lysobacter yananisis]
MGGPSGPMLLSQVAAT